MTEKSDERLDLEAQAISLGIAFQANIGDAKLTKRIEKHKANKQPDTGIAGATDDGSQLQTGAATDAAPTNSGVRTQGGGLAEANVAGGQADPNETAGLAGTTDTAKTTDSETSEAGAPKSASIVGGPKPVIGAQVSIVGPKRGRWRAGMHFTAEPRIFAIDDLTNDEITAISPDDKLTVTPVE